jgi:hypothetical protein
MNKFAMLAEPARDQRGMALISALLLLLVISLLAVGLSMDSSMDVRGAAYQRFRARAFGSAEAGLMAATDILEENAFVGGWTNPNGLLPFTFPNLSEQYDDINPGTINILQDGVFYMDKNDLTNPPNTIMQMTGDIEADIITQYITSQLAYGGAIQVAAGYGGSGKGVGGGGGHIIYNIQSTGRDGAVGSEQASTVLALNYRYVTK